MDEEALLGNHCPGEFGYEEIDGDTCEWDYDACERCWNREANEK